MFEKIAKFRMLRARRMAPASLQLVPANDNRIGAIRPGRRRPRLVCRWTFDQGPSCRWEIAAPQEANPLLADEVPGPFTQLSSYCRTTGWARSGRATRCGPRSRPICCRHVTSGQ